MEGLAAALTGQNTKHYYAGATPKKGKTMAKKKCKKKPGKK
jgi:hypothetical protein